MPSFRDIEEVREFIRKTDKDTAVYVGCDSRQLRDRTVFVTVIVVHLSSKHGAKVFWKVDKTKKISSLRQRLMEEVNRAVYHALLISDVIDGRHFEVHLDINPDENTASSVIVKEAVGYVLAQGLKPVLKPDAIAASCAADYITEKY
ncbi:ribonuclease H-like YkuK family protein [Aquifex pyrophilus]